MYHIAARRIVAACAAAIAAVALCVLSAPLGANPAGASIRQGPRWSGEVAFASHNHTQTFSTVTGAWVQPAITDAPGAVDTWVGITGIAVGNELDDYALLQAGTEAFNNNGTIEYYPWVIAWDGSSSGMHILDYPVKPGDHLAVTLARVGNTTWSLDLVDTTEDWKYSNVFTYPAKGASAEWIAEAPMNWATGSPMNLATFSTVAFSTVRADTVVPIATESVLTHDGNVIAWPIAMNSTTGSFRVHYGTCGPGTVIENSVVGITDPNAVTVESAPGLYQACYASPV